MGDFGRSLRQLRESQGLSPERASGLTRVPVHHLIALESEQFQVLPSVASARGFVRLLAKLYKVDAQALVSQYEATLASGSAAPAIPLSQTNATIFKAQPSGRGHAGLSAGVGAVILILLALGWMRGNQESTVLTALAPETKEAASKAPSARRPAAEPAPAIEPEPVAPGQPSTVVAGNESAPVATPPVSPPPPVETPSFRLEIQANEQSWVQAAVDGGEVREALLQAGERLLWTATDAMDVTIGNAGGLVLMFNGESAPVLGEPGQVVRLRVTKDGIDKVRKFRSAPRPETLPSSALAF